MQILCLRDQKWNHNNEFCLRRNSLSGHNEAIGLNFLPFLRLAQADELTNGRVLSNKEEDPMKSICDGRRFWFLARVAVNAIECDIHMMCSTDESENGSHSL